jgi:hypothetical protein
MTITFFSIPKPFEGRTETIQLNAIRSWKQLGEVILFGDEAGVREAAAKTGALHVEHIERNEHGTPIVADALAQVESLSTSDTLCLVNSDIVLFDDLVAAAVRVRPPFLMVGESWNAAIAGPIDFHDGWQQRLRTLPRRKRGADAIDYFLYSRGLYERVPPFAIGRTAFDNWLIWSARASGASVVDATSVVRSIHQAHDYVHAGSLDQIRTGPEAIRNRELAGGKAHLYSRFDATHRLTRSGLLPNPLRFGRIGERMRRALYKLRHRVLGLPAE